jgi:hypothetical protein
MYWRKDRSRMRQLKHVGEENYIVKCILLVDMLGALRKALYSIAQVYGTYKVFQAYSCKFKVCQSVHHHTIQINQPTRCNNISSLLLEFYVQLNMFRTSSRPSSGAQLMQWQPLVLLLERGDSSAVGRGRAGPTTNNSTVITTLQR